MRYKTFVSMSIAVIGSDKIAAAYARSFALAGHEVMLASLEGDDIADDMLMDSMRNVYQCSIEEAAGSADLIIIATAPKDVRAVAYWLGDVRKKVIIDATSNVDAPDDELLKTVCGIQAITGSPHIVKVFDARGYDHLMKPLFGKKNVDLIMVSDCRKAKEIVKILGADLGMDSFHDFGGNDTILLFNGVTRCLRNLAVKPTHIYAVD